MDESSQSHKRKKSEDQQDNDEWRNVQFLQLLNQTPLKQLLEWLVILSKEIAQRDLVSEQLKSQEQYMRELMNFYESELKTTRQEVEKLKTEDVTNNYCCVCMEKRLEQVLDPCGHQLCDTCAHKLTSCPICEKPIGKLVKTFRS